MLFFLVSLLLVSANGASFFRLGNDFQATDDSIEKVRAFISNVGNAIGHRDKLDPLFNGGFIFSGCHEEFYKGHVVDYLSALPEGTPLNFIIGSSTYIDSQLDIEFTATFTGFKKSPIQAKFFLYRKNGGYVLNRAAKLAQNC